MSKSSKSRGTSVSLMIKPVAAVSAIALLAPAVYAVDYNFTGPVGAPASYNLGANWSGGVVPGAGDAAFIDGTRIANHDAAAASSLNALFVGNSSTGELRVPTGSITTGSLRIGNDAGALGTILINGGSLTSTGNAVWGEASNQANLVTVSSGSLALPAENYLGANGRGTLTINGGTVTAGRFNVGNSPNSSGAINITGGSLSTTDTIIVGLRGLGTYTQSAGTVSLNRMTMGLENDGPSGGPAGDGKGRGQATVSGGSLTVANPMVLGEVSREDNQLNVSGGTVTMPELYAGANGRGTLNVSAGGTVNIVGQMHLGAGGTGNGTLNVTGGNLNMTGGGGWILVGQNGIGTFNFSGGAIDTKIVSVGQDPTSTGTATQTGGSLRSQATLVVGETSTAGGTYTASAGTIDVGTVGLDPDGAGIFVGSYSGKGIFNINGTAAVSSRSGLTVGYGEGGGADGTVNVNGGSLTTVTSGDEGRARIGVYAGATGRLNVTAGTVNFAGAILNGVARGGVGVGGTGQITVSGGSLTAASMLNETSSTFTQTGGVSSLGVVTGRGSMSVSGGTVSVTRITQSGLSVSETGNVNIANSPTPTASVVGTLTTSGSGKIDLTNNGLVVDYTGTSPIASIRAALAAGRIVGTQTPADARQSVAYAEASALGVTSFLGTDVDGSAVVLRSRLRGDADFSGTVNFADLVKLAQNYNTATDSVWTRGDFNYDGATNFADLVALAQNYNQGVAAITVGSLEFQSDWARAQSFVPEPTSLLAIAAAGVLGGRRRRSY